MNKKNFFLRTFAITAVASILVLSACKKSNVENTNQMPVAGLMAFNLVPEKTVAFTIGGNILSNVPLAFNSYTGVYLPVYPGTRTVEAFDYMNNTSLATASDSFAVDKYYSVFVIGTSGNYRNVIVNDNVDDLSPSNGRAYIRYIHAINGSANASVTVSGSSANNSSIPFGNVSDFVAVTPGNTTITVTDGNTVNVNRTITTEAKKVYTVLLTSGATSSEAAQIKFITNGTLEDEVSGQRVSSTSATKSIQ